MSEQPTFHGWHSVPGHLWTRTQLVVNDLPRIPGGPVSGWVKTRDWRERPATVALFDARESTPTRASLAQLEAAGRRRSAARRRCGDCGAMPERPLFAEDRSDGRARCPACTHIAALRAELARVSEARADASRWAAALLAQTNTAAVVHIEQVLRPPAPSGRRNPHPVAVRVEILDPAGEVLVDATVRTGGPRARAMPPDAVDVASVAERLDLLVRTRALIVWSHDALAPLWRYVLARPSPAWSGPGASRSMAGRVAHWRGELDPHTGVLRTPLPPGRADRMLLLLRRMADGVRDG